MASRWRCWDLSFTDETFSSQAREKDRDILPVPGCRDIATIDILSFRLPKEALRLNSDSSTWRCKGRGKSLANRALRYDGVCRRPGEIDSEEKTESVIASRATAMGFECLYDEVFPSLQESFATETKASKCKMPSLYHGIKQKTSDERTTTMKDSCEIFNNDDVKIEKSALDVPIMIGGNLYKTVVGGDVVESRCKSMTFDDDLNDEELENCAQNLNGEELAAVSEYFSSNVSSMSEALTDHHAIAQDHRFLEEKDCQDFMENTTKDDFKVKETRNVLPESNHKIDYVDLEEAMKQNLLKECKNNEIIRNLEEYANKGENSDNDFHSYITSSFDDSNFGKSKYAIDGFKKHILDTSRLEEMQPPPITVTEHFHESNCVVENSSSEENTGNLPIQDIDDENSSINDDIILNEENMSQTRPEEEEITAHKDKNNTVEECSSSDTDMEPCNVLIENLPLAFTEEELRELVEPYGEFQSHNFIESEDSKTCTLRMSNLMIGELLAVSVDGLEIDGFRTRARVNENYS